MTDRQIQELLLTHYLFAIEMVKGNDGNNLTDKNIVYQMRVDYGICNCSDCLLKTSFCFETPLWINKYLNGKTYLGPPPYSARNKSQILSRLKLRVDILNKEIQLSK